MPIRPYTEADREAVVALSLRAWAPVFVSIKESLEPTLYQHFFPDWRDAQQKSVEEVLADANMNTWVAEEDGRIAGFTAVAIRSAEMGEIYMIAVDPDFQGRRVGSELTQFACAWMREQGVPVAMVETGADPGHAPARRTYERAGFQQWPAARYFKLLQ